MDAQNESEILIKQLYAKDYTVSADNRVFEVPENGSLGLLAAGYEGLIAWRKKRVAVQLSRK